MNHKTDASSVAILAFLATAKLMELLDKKGIVSEAEGAGIYRES